MKRTLGRAIQGDAVQDFDNDMFLLQGELFGDPDFDLLRITGGTGNGMPSPGHTTLTRLGPPGSSFNVDSFFDVEYRIEFQGAPGSILEGFGTPLATSDTIRMSAGEPATGSDTAVVGQDHWRTIQPTELVFGGDTGGTGPATPPIPADFFGPGIVAV